MTTWTDRIDRAREAVAGWRARLLVPDRPQASSSLAADDLVYPEMPCSQLAWWGMSVGVEHLDATIRLFDQQVSSGGPILPAANYTVLRAALVGSSQATVLLAPRKRDERTTYGLQIAHEEYRQALNYRERVINHPGLMDEARAASERKDYLAALRRAKGTVVAQLHERDAATKLTDTAMIERAAELVHTKGEDADLLRSSVVMEWALGSGAAHGRLLMNLHRTDGHRREHGNMALLGASYEQVVTQISGVSLILNEGWRQWDLRRSA